MMLGTPEHASEVTEGRHPSTRDALQWLTFHHLPAHMQDFSRPFYQTAVEVIMASVDSPELTKALNALTEAKDWAVRAGIRTQTGRAGSVPRPQQTVNPPVLSRTTAETATAKPGNVVAPPVSTKDDPDR